MKVTLNKSYMTTLGLCFICRRVREGRQMYRQLLQKGLVGRVSVPAVTALHGSFSIINIPNFRGMVILPAKATSHFLGTHHSIVPVFQHSNCERSELT